MQNDLDQLIETMTQLGKLVKQEFTPMQDENSPTLLQILAVRYIYINKKVTIGDLAGNLQLSKSSATQLIERLVTAGLVRRVSDESDRRIIRLELTETGEKDIAAFKAKRIEKVKKIFSQIPVSDIKELIRIHTNIIETLKKDQKS